MQKYQVHFVSANLERKLIKTDRLYLNFLDSIPVPVIITDSQLIIRYFNRATPGSLSLFQQELRDKPLQSILKGPGTLQNLKNKTFKTFLNKFTDTDGQFREISISPKLSAIKTESQLIEFFFQIIPDSVISIIPAAQSKISFLQSSTNSGYWELDAGRKKFRASIECLKILDLKVSPGNIGFNEFQKMLLRKEDRKSIESGLISITNTQKAFETVIKIRNVKPENNKSRVLRFYSNWTGSGSQGYYRGVIQDVSVTKKVEKELLKAKEKAESSDRLKSYFLTNLSYELRTPMNAVLGFTELLSLGDLSSKQKQDYNNIIRSKGNALLSKIDEIIEFSKFETGNIPINKSEFHLYPVLKELFDEYQTLLINSGKPNIQLLLKVPDDSESQIIYTDPGRLQQLLSNLLSNAMKFTENGEIEFGYRKSGKFFKFFVKDTGIGIDDEDQNLIFNRFHETSDATLKKFSGSGLSLTLSKYIVELLGGKIKVKSELNKGSKFQISIPMEFHKKNSEEINEFDEPVVLNWKDKVIVIAEDEEVNYRFLEAVLLKTQAQVLRAKNGKEAVDLCKNISKVDLVLMDIKMPLMNGYDATREIKKHRPLLPVIAQTAFSTQDEILKCEKAGCEDVITKPIEIKALLRKISNLLI